MATGTIKAVVAKGDIANNLTTDTAGKVLDARQGKALNDNLKNVVGGTDVGDFASESALVSALDSRLSSIGIYESIVFQFRFTGSETPPFVNGRRYSCHLVKGASSNYASAEFKCNSGIRQTISGTRGSGGWAWNELAFKSDRPVTQFSVPMSSSITIAIPNSSAFTIVFTGNSGNLCGIATLYSSGSGTTRISTASPCSNISLSVSGNVLTIDNSNAGSNCSVYFDGINGNVPSLAMS